MDPLQVECVATALCDLDVPVRLIEDSFVKVGIKFTPEMLDKLRTPKALRLTTNTSPVVPPQSAVVAKDAPVATTSAVLGGTISSVATIPAASIPSVTIPLPTMPTTTTSADSLVQATPPTTPPTPPRAVAAQHDFQFPQRVSSHQPPQPSFVRSHAGALQHQSLANQRKHVFDSPHQQQGFWSPAQPQQYPNTQLYNSVDSHISNPPHYNSVDSHISNPPHHQFHRQHHQTQHHQTQYHQIQHHQIQPQPQQQMQHNPHSTLGVRQRVFHLSEWESAPLDFRRPNVPASKYETLRQTSASQPRFPWQDGSQWQ